MRIVEVRPSKKFAGAWLAFEAPGVEPAFAAPDARQKAFEYARGRFGGSAGAIHVYDEAGENVTERIQIDGGRQFGQA